jgi:hypothetical protein
MEPGRLAGDRTLLRLDAVIARAKGLRNRGLLPNWITPLICSLADFRCKAAQGNRIIIMFGKLSASKTSDSPFLLLILAREPSESWNGPGSLLDPPTANIPKHHHTSLHPALTSQTLRNRIISLGAGE